MLKNFWGHLKLITKHRIMVFRLSIKAGIPWRGFVHDLSKYSPTEFIPGVKYFNGKKSPISVQREKEGYSLAWIHHKAKNKHHVEYWVDYQKNKILYVPMPFKYACEMVCDQQAAGITYMGKDWTKEYELEYWNKVKPYFHADEGIKIFIEKVHTEVAKNGIDKTINKKNLKKWYKEFVIDRKF